VNRFWDLLEQSVIVSGTIALGFMLTVCYLACTGQEIPDTLASAAMIILGYFFGAKAQATGTRALDKRKEGEG